MLPGVREFFARPRNHRAAPPCRTDPRQRHAPTSTDPRHRAAPRLCPRGPVAASEASC